MEIHTLRFSLCLTSNPAGTGPKLLVGLESLAGTLLIALFVFVLGRRVAR